MVTAVIIFLGMILLLLFWRQKNTSGKTSLALLSVWIVKYLDAAEVYSKGKLAENRNAFIQEAKTLNSVYPHFIYFIA